MQRLFALAAFAVVIAASTYSTGWSQALKLQQGDHICLVGNELGERMQHDNHWETLLHAAYPDLQLTVRNLCFPGDEVVERIRSKNFGSPDSHLKHSGASVVLFFFGFNESFRGEKGMDQYAQQLDELIKSTLKQDYSGKGAPRIVVVSPIAFENTGNANLPDGKVHNANLELYTKRMSEVAKANQVGFIDLFHPTLKLFETTDQQLTLDGCHLSDLGNEKVAPLLMTGLFGSSTTVPADRLATIRKEINDKNFHWWHRYRAVNGFSIWGDRGAAGSDGTYNNTDVMERERAILDQMTANRDARIWSLASGKTVPATCDDSNTLPELQPRTNVGIKDDPNAKAGKLGSLEYLTGAEQKKKFKLAQGYEIELFASEEQFPELAKPVAIKFDNAGRLWVSTMPSYPHWRPKTKLDDKIIILEDKNGDGKADQCKVFADGLHQPTGFEIGHGGAYVAEQPDILFLKDTDGDDRADVKVRQLIGFCSADSHHGPAGFTWCPGGNLYFQEGTFKYSQVEAHNGLTRMAEGGVWVYNPISKRFGAHVSFAFSNPWGHVFDRWGQNFIADASPGFSYWAAPISGDVIYPYKHPGGSQYSRVAGLIGANDAKYVFPTFYPKRTRPSAGCEIVSSRHFPDEAQGNFLLSNCIGDRAVLNHTLNEDGTGFAGKELAPLLYCDDGNFRPIELQFGPDGALYIADWHNALIGHLQHNLREPNRDKTHGRIWRVTYPSRPLLTPPKIAGQPVSALLPLLKSYEDRTRYNVRRELAAKKPDEVIPELQKWSASLDPNEAEFEHHLLEVLWAYQSQNVVQKDLLIKLLQAKDHRARAAAVRVLSFWLDRIDDPLELLRARVNDPHGRVRLEAVRAISFLRGEEATEVALEVLEHDMDPMLQFTLDETIKTLEKATE